MKYKKIVLRKVVNAAKKNQVLLVEKKVVPERFELEENEFIDLNDKDCDDYKVLYDHPLIEPYELLDLDTKHVTLFLEFNVEKWPELNEIWNLY